MRACFLVALALLGSPALAKISGPWYYIADGLSASFAYQSVPAWLDNYGNWISLAFLNPAELSQADPIPQAFKDAASHFNAKGKTVFFSIGGYGFMGNWNWIGDSGTGQSLGAKCCTIAKQYGVGIEIDYEGGAAPDAGVTGFIKGFRQGCPMGKYWLTMDLYGSPGGAGWQSGTVPKVLPPTGAPGDVYNDGNWLDYVNVMVVDGQLIDNVVPFWDQWFATSYLNPKRTTFGLVAGSATGIAGYGFCSGDAASKSLIDTAYNKVAAKDVWGFTSWAVCPSNCGDWIHTCDGDAPGFQYLCQKMNACTGGNNHISSHKASSKHSSGDIHGAAAVVLPSVAAGVLALAAL